MAEEFSDRDLSGAVFWGVQLVGARFRDANLDGSEFFHTSWKNVSIDGEIDRLVVNGVDVTEFVNQHDRWHPIRYRLSPPDAAGIRASWNALGAEWSTLMSKVDLADTSVVSTSVDGEWSLHDTLRHLLFAMDKWFTLPILGEREFCALGLPNSGSRDRDWPGLDTSLDADFATVMRVRDEQHARFTAYVASLDVATLPASVDVLENGAVPALMCFHVVLEEEFEHLRYMIRDLDRLGIS